MTQKGSDRDSPTILWFVSRELSLSQPFWANLVRVFMKLSTYLALLTESS